MRARAFAQALRLAVSCVVGILLGRMSLLSQPVLDEEVSEALGLFDAEVAFIFDGSKLSFEVQAKIAQLGYTDITVFAKVEDSLAGVRESLKSDVTLEPSASPAHL